MRNNVLKDLISIARLSKSKLINFREPFFDVAVSNPPYQRDTGNGAVAVYHLIMNTAELVSQNISMIYPARWTNTGRGEGIQDFREKELNSRHYRTFVVHSGEKDVFEDATIKGGVNYFHWNSTPLSKNEKMLYVYDSIEENRTTLLNGQETMIVNPLFSKIISKVNTKEHFVIMSRNHYGQHLEADHNIEQYAASLPDDAPLSYKTLIYYSGMGGGVRSIHIPKNTGKHSDEGYKVLVSRTADPDKKRNTLRRQNRIFVITPGEICGGSFLQAGQFDTEIEAVRCVKYLRSHFAMFLLGALCLTQNTTKGNYMLIPDVDFLTGCIKDFKNDDNCSKLDFEKDLDEQLFAIYDFSQDEINFISSMVKPWQDNVPIFGKDYLR